MIVKEIFYAVKCNRCSKIHNETEYSFWSAECDAIEQAMQSEWTEIEGKHYCTECYEFNDEKDDYVAKRDFPEHVDKITNFLQKIANCYSVEVLDSDDFFIISARLSYQKNKLFYFDENYILESFKGKIISLEYEALRYGNHKCLIKVLKI